MDYTIKDLPEEERPREKLEEHGAESLTDVELLSIIIRTGIPGKNVKELSSEILNSHSLKGLRNRSLQELEEFDGVSRVKAGQLKSVGELAARMQLEQKQSIESFSDVKARVEDMKYLETEKLRVFHLSSGNEVLEEQELDGGVDSVNLDFQKVLRRAVKKNAAAVILAHNHPSGKPDPTPGDVEATEQLIEAAEGLGISVLDHVIVGETASSMKASTDLKFP